MTPRGIVFVLLGIAAAAVVFVLARFDPPTAGFYPPCLFHRWSGLHCPGCGSLRAFHALLRGDWHRALSFNALTVLAAPFLLGGSVRELWRRQTGRDPIGYRIPAWAIRILLALILAFAVLRNVPQFSWLAPG